MFIIAIREIVLFSVIFILSIDAKIHIKSINDNNGIGIYLCRALCHLFPHTGRVTILLTFVEAILTT